MSDENAPESGPDDEPDREGEAGSVAESPALPPLEAAQAEAQKLKEQLYRVAADFDNYKKRARRELADTSKLAREDVLKELLPVFDNLERATAHANTTTDAKALADGIGMVMRQFLDTLGKIGIERIQ